MSRTSELLDEAHSAIDQQAGWIVAASLLLFVILTFTSRLFDVPLRWPICIGATLVLLASILLFTRPLKAESDINAIFRFAWLFLAAVMITGIVTLYATVRPPDDPSLERKPDPKSAASAYESKADAVATDPNAFRRELYVIALVRGCDFNSDKSRRSPTNVSQLKEGTDTSGTPLTRPTNPAMPPDLNCGDLPPQWVISIGGSIVKCHYDGTCPKDPRPKDHAPALKKQLIALEVRIRELDVRSAALARQIGAARIFAEDEIAYDGPSEVDLSAMQKKVAEDRVGLVKQSQDLRERIDASEGWEDLAKNIEGGPIVGGIVVPVYFVVLACIGALISMMRKLPEFQNRVTERYAVDYKAKLANPVVGDPPLPPISYEYARDLTIFQILQVISAPAIAVVAYAWARPEQLMTTVLLAFAAGFSSEVFLLAIRSVVDRVIGLGPTPLRLRAVEEQVSTAGTVAIPPRTPNSPSAPTAAGKFKLGDLVELATPINAFMPGARGVVAAITTGGELIVKVTNDHIGTPYNVTLDPRPPAFFREPGKDPDADPLPAPAG